MDPVILKLIGMELNIVRYLYYNFIQLEMWEAFTGKFKTSYQTYLK